MPSSRPLDDAGWRPADATTIENRAFAVSVDPDRGGAVTSLIDKRTSKQLVQAGEVANELRVYREYPNHPLFAEGPWHLTPDGRMTSATAFPAEITIETSPIGQRIVVEGPVDESRWRQEIRLWADVDRIEMTTSLHDYRGHDRLFRGSPRRHRRRDRDLRGWECGHRSSVRQAERGCRRSPVHARPSSVQLVRSGCDCPGGARRRGGPIRRSGIAGDQRGRDRRADDARLDSSLRDLVVALVRQALLQRSAMTTATAMASSTSTPNLPDVRVAVGGPDQNRSVSLLLDAVERGYRDDLDRQPTGQGWARLWIPQEGHGDAEREPIPDLRDPRALPVLIVAGADAEMTIQALEAVISDLGEGRVIEPAGNARWAELRDGELHGRDPEPRDAGLQCRGRRQPVPLADALVQRLAVRRVDRPAARATPDGANFQFQHWSHHFEYAVAGGPGDWRDGGIVRTGHEYNTPLIARTFDSHGGQLPPATSFVEVEPASVVLTALKPAGNPAARMASMDVDPASGVALRCTSRLVGPRGRRFAVDGP